MNLIHYFFGKPKPKPVKVTVPAIEMTVTPSIDENSYSKRILWTAVAVYKGTRYTARSYDKMTAIKQVKEAINKERTFETLKEEKHLI